MSQTPDDPTRRLLLSAAAAGLTLSIATPGSASTPGPAADASPAGKPAPGRPGEFDFLSGEWKIQHRRRKADGSWDAFEGEATCWSILGGIASIEELRIPARDFSGMGLRLLDLDTRIWSDFWVNAKSGALGGAGLTGGFVDGDGIFESRDTEDGKPVIYRGVWDRIVAGERHRWYQASSHDDGRTWDISWSMDWTRA